MSSALSEHTVSRSSLWSEIIVSYTVSVKLVRRLVCVKFQEELSTQLSGPTCQSQDGIYPVEVSDSAPGRKPDKRSRLISSIWQKQRGGQIYNPEQIVYHRGLRFMSDNDTPSVTLTRPPKLGELGLATYGHTHTPIMAQDLLLMVPGFSPD